VDSKYTLVHIAARRAREINLYYHSLGEGLGQYTPPLVEQVDSNKPLSIALEEIAAGKIVPQYPGDAQREAEELLGGEDTGDAQDDEDAAEVLSLGGDEAPAEGPADDDA
jgi:DNA-directed RNA polymerase subunit omega